MVTTPLAWRQSPPLPHSAPAFVHRSPSPGRAPQVVPTPPPPHKRPRPSAGHPLGRGEAEEADDDEEEDLQSSDSEPEAEAPLRPMAASNGAQHRASRYANVYLQSRSRGWYGQLSHRNERLTTRFFATEEQAAMAVDR